MATPKLIINWQEVGSVLQSDYDEVIAERDEALLLVPPNLWERNNYQDFLDWRFALSTYENFEKQCAYDLNIDNWHRQYYWIYFYKLATWIPPDYWRIGKGYAYLLYLDFTWYTWTVLNLWIPVDCDNSTRLYLHVARTTTNNMWAQGIMSFDNTLRNLRNNYFINLERQNLSEAQQISLLESIRTEIENGMWFDYQDASTTARLIDFQSTSSHRNDLVTESALVAIGWTKLNSSQYYKYILQNWVNKRWRVLINNT